MLRLRRALLRSGAFAVVAAAVGLGLVACGGDDDSSRTVPSSGAVQGDGSDARYVELVCGATKKFNDAVQEIVRGVTNSGQSQPNQAQTEKLVAKPTAEFASALAAIRAPEDLRAWHDANASQLAAVAKAYDSGTTPPTQAAPPQLSAAASQRLTKLAAQDADCSKVGGSPFGGAQP